MEQLVLQLVRQSLVRVGVLLVMLVSSAAASDMVSAGSFWYCRNLGDHVFVVRLRRGGLLSGRADVASTSALRDRSACRGEDG